MMTLIWKAKTVEIHWDPLPSPNRRSSLGLALTALTLLDPNPDPILRAHRSEQIFLRNGLGKCNRGNDAVVAVEPHLSRLRFRLLLLLRSSTLLLWAPLLQSRSSPKGFGSLSLSLSLCFCFLVWVNFDTKTCRSRSFFESMRSGSGGKCKRWLLEATEHSLPHPVHCLLLENKFLLSITILNLWYSFFFFIFLF